MWKVGTAHEVLWRVWIVLVSNFNHWVKTTTILLIWPQIIIHIKDIQYLGLTNYSFVWRLLLRQNGLPLSNNNDDKNFIEACAQKELSHENMYDWKMFV